MSRSTWRSVSAAAVMLTVMYPVASPRAQDIKFSCPKAGTAIEIKDLKMSWQGTVPGSPTTCLRTDIYQKSEEAIFNFYADDVSGGKAARAAMADLFSGAKPKVEFLVVFKTTRETVNSTETWTRLGREQIQVAGRAIDAWTFEQERRYSTGLFHATRKLWFDPATGLFVKGSGKVLEGQARNWPSWEYTAIKVP